MLLANKLIEKITDPSNAKEHYQTFIRKKNRKLVKQFEISTYQPKAFENPNITNIKSVITEHSKISYKTMFTSYRIGFFSVWQNYTVWWEHTFPSNIYAEYEFKKFEHYFNVFWCEKKPFLKKQEKAE